MNVINRLVTLVLFVGILIPVGVYFFRIVQPFLLPLLMAGTLALLAQPVFPQVVSLMRGHRRLAAVFMSVVAALLVVLPVFVALGFATQELIKYGTEVVEVVQYQHDPRLAETMANLKQECTENEFASLSDALLDGDSAHAAPADSRVNELLLRLNDFSPEEIARYLRAENGAAYLDTAAIPFLDQLDRWLSPYVTRSDIDELRSSGLAMARAILVDVYEKTTGLLTNVISFIIGFVIMLLAFYYFLADGPRIADELKGLLPLDPEDESTVIKQFETICRGVVVGTLVAAVVQAVLLSAALAVFRVPGIWLLTCLTVLTGLIPFVGASGVYIPVAGYLIFNERYAAAIMLLAYGIGVVSTADNLVRAYAISGTSRLHPLMALISAIGAMKLVGLLGIFVGPIVAGIFYALLKILQQKLNEMKGRRIVVPSA